MNSKITLSAILVVTATAGMPLLAHAQFGDLLKQLQQLQAPRTGTSAVGGQPAASATARGGGLLPSDQWCAEQSGALRGIKWDDTTKSEGLKIISSEFKILDEETLQDKFLEAFRKEKINKTFPNARFFRASFETGKVRAIYDSFIGFPEPVSLYALIQISRSRDQQERADALMALTFLHLQAPELSIDKDRWFGLFQSALRGGDHFTALVFRARMNAYGEFGTKNLGQALGDLVTAGQLQNKYVDTGGAPKEFDAQNYKLVHTETAKDIFYNEPNMPYRQQWQGPAEMGRQIEQAQQAYNRQLPNTRIGRIYAEADKLNKESIELGNAIILKTQGGNQLVGQIESLKSLRESTAGEKPVFADVSPEVHVAQLRMVNRVPSLNQEQKAMLIRAQEKRLTAQGLIRQTYGELLQMMMSNMGGNIVQMAATAPAFSLSSNALIQSCIISAKWEQAMRSKDTPKPSPQKAESEVKDLASRYKD